MTDVTVAAAIDPILAWLVATVVLVGLALGVSRLAAALRRDVLDGVDLPGRAAAIDAHRVATAEVAEAVAAIGASAAVLYGRLNPAVGQGSDRTIPPG